GQETAGPPREQHAESFARGGRAMPVRACPLFIDGRWINGDRGSQFEVLNPATSEPVALVPDGGPDQARAAVDAAARAFPQWAALTALERGKVLLRARDLLAERTDALARLITEENGKPLAEARGEVTFAIQYLTWFAEEARRVYGGRIQRRGGQARGADRGRVHARQPRPQDRIHGVHRGRQGPDGPGRGAAQARGVRTGRQRPVHRLRRRGPRPGGRQRRGDQIP